MKLAFIVQRYGTEILGGAEYACRLLAEHLVQRHDIEVLTTCARDYITWKNEYPEGQDRIRGVTVRRFANARTRDIAAFDRYSDWIYHHPHDRADEIAILRARLAELQSQNDARRRRYRRRAWLWALAGVLYGIALGLCLSLVLRP